MRTIPVALQLYTVRDMMQKDVPETLRAVKAIGYDYVEPAGLFGMSADAFRKALDDAGLTAVCAHVPLAEMSADTEKFISVYKTIGCKYVAVPYLPEEQRYGTPAFEATLAEIARIADMCLTAGMPLLYHNHDFEFTKMPDGRYVLDYMYDTIPALATELDLCWVRVGGEDPAEYVRKYAHRAPVVHLKDYVGVKGEASPYALLGQAEADGEKEQPAFAFRPFGHGCQDAESIVLAGIESGARWFVVEQDLSLERPPLEAARMSIDTLREMGVKK